MKSSTIYRMAGLVIEREIAARIVEAIAKRRALNIHDLSDRGDAAALVRFGLAVARRIVEKTEPKPLTPEEIEQVRKEFEANHAI